MTMNNTTEISFAATLANDRLVGVTPSMTTRCHNLCPDPHDPRALIPVGQPPVATDVPDSSYGTGLPRELYDITIECDQSRDISATLPTIYLLGDYTHCQGPLDSTDTRRLTANFRTAYNQMDLQAMYAGLSIQPRLMAWRLIDTDGNVIISSVPKLMCVPDHPFSAVNPMFFNLNKDSAGNLSQIPQTVITACSYRTFMLLPDFTRVPDHIGRRIARLEVLATPPLHPVSFTASAPTRLDAVDSYHATLTTYMPGTAIDMAPAAEQRLGLIESALHHFDSLADVVFTVIRPIKPKAERVYIVPMPNTPVPAARIAAMERIMSQTVTPSLTDTEVQCSAPNTFTAGTSLESGDTLFMADITPQRFDGFLPEAYAAERQTDNSDFRQLTKTEFAGTGEVTVAHAVTEGGRMPVRLSALIVSPHPDATSMTMRIAPANGPVLSYTFPLKPSPCGRYSYCLSADLMPHTPVATDDDYVVPAAIIGSCRLSNLILAAPAAAPNAITGHCTVGQGIIHRITRAMGSASAWDFARQHLLVWASDGIYTLSVNASRTSLGATRLHPAGVTRRDAVASTPWAIYGALTDGSVCAITGSRLTPLIRAGTAVAIGYDPTRHELWMKPPAQSAPEMLVMPVPAHKGHYTRSGPMIDSFTDAGTRLLATATDGTVYDLSAPCTDATDAVAVEYKARLQSRLPRGNRLRRMEWDVQSADADITASLHTDAGTGPANAYLIMRHSSSGPLNAPVCSRLSVRPMTWIGITVSGMCHPDTRIGPLTLFG